MAVDGSSLKLTANPLFGTGPTSSAEIVGSGSETIIKEKVSWIDSFLGSTDNSAASSLREEDKALNGLSLAKKLQRAKYTKGSLKVESKGISKSSEKHGKNKKLSSAKILGSLKVVQSIGRATEGKVELRAGGGSSAPQQQMDMDSEAAPVGLDMEVLSPAKKGKHQHAAGPP